MKEKLIIKNFGPIKSVELDLGKMTILIGEQATGKSTIAKVLAVCRYFSYLNDYSYFKSFADPFKVGLTDFGIDGYFNENSIINYESKDYKVEVFYGIRETDNDENGNQIISIRDCSSTVTPLSDRYKLLLETLNKSTPWYKPKKEFDYAIDTNILQFGSINDTWLNWYPNDNFFQFDVKNVMNNPFYIPTERGLQSIFSLGKSSIQNISDSLFNQFAKMDMFARNFQSETEIKPLEIVYKNVNGQGFIKNKSQSVFSSLYNGASGYQSTIPVVLAIKYYTEKRNKKKTFIIEEPELNLFPKAQKKLMEFFVENINKNGHSFLLPTHSPYFLSAINDLLMAYKKGKTHPKEVEEIIRIESWLNPDDLSVYQLKDGFAYNIFNKELNLIGENIIDEVSDEMNDEFDQLLDIR